MTKQSIAREKEGDSEPVDLSINHETSLSRQGQGHKTMTKLSIMRDGEPGDQFLL